MKKIYVYEDIHYPGWIKVGETTRAPEERVREQYITTVPCPPFPYRILFTCNAVNNFGEEFSDHNVHDMMCAMGIKRGYGEWFLGNSYDVQKAVENLKKGITIEEILQENALDL